MNWVQGDRIFKSSFNYFTRSPLSRLSVSGAVVNVCTENFQGVGVQPIHGKLHNIYHQPVESSYCEISRLPCVSIQPDLTGCRGLF
ncbi:MAG: hypothetical protein RIG63_28255 [Coleofasciculus chthonoplastes F3-SA18-01]|uniref:hypothetical protein n=1 Tax=Coleofasciculus chthonoplastes TaxID=64178 RepID=UPI0032F5EAB7